MASLTAYASEQEPLGYFRIFARPPGGYRREITLFRGAPIKLSSVTTGDPFTDITAQISFPQITVFDHLGEGDLDWMVADCDIDIVFQPTGAYELAWTWEGYIASFQMSLTGSESSVSVDLKGAFFGLDDYLAIPTFPRRPIPYEILIARAFDQELHPTRLGGFQMLFPRGWNIKVPEFKDPKYLSALKPYGVSTGKLWTGFTSRSTGSWEPLLTGHVQSMLQVMYAQGGSQWSIRNRGQRRAELYLRTIPDSTDDSIIEIFLGAPGVSFEGTRDYSQRAGVIYGQGSDEAGITYNGMEITPDGRTTYFKPFAYSARSYPRRKNPMYDPRVKPKETMVSFQQGVDEITALKIAQAQYQRFAEPGITGTVTLLTDPRYSDGSLCPRMLIKAGATIRLHGLMGVKEGVLAHVVGSSVDFNALSTTLTYDTKYRDQLTVEEVQARTRDALNPLHALQVGKYSNTINDLIIPWSYKAGSGMIPTPAMDFFKLLPSTARFPYEEWTRKYPPKDPHCAPYYIKIGPTDTNNANNNWSGVIRDGKMTMAIPIRMGQAGTIRLTQLAAYDRDGNVMKVKFHFSLYYGNGVASDGMPKFPLPMPGEPNYVATGPKAPPPYLKPVTPAGVPIAHHYKAFQANPFYKGAWENVMEDGTSFKWAKDANLPTEGANLVVGWGNYYQPAGYSPGRLIQGSSRTGMLVDSTQWGWDVASNQNIDFQNPANNINEEYVGMLFVQIYCDDQGDQPVYFMGRLIRVDPGQTN